MLIDTLLRWIGDNPSLYSRDSDKWAHLLSYFQFEYFYPSLPYILLVIPWVYFLFQRKKHTKHSQKFLKKIIIFSIAGLLIGYVVPYLILAILASLAAYSMYGGTI